MIRTLAWAKRRPLLAQGSSCDGSSHLLVLQQPDVRVSLVCTRLWRLLLADLVAFGHLENSGPPALPICAKEFCTLSARMTYRMFRGRRSAQPKVRKSWTLPCLLVRHSHIVTPCATGCYTRPLMAAATPSLVVLR